MTKAVLGKPSFFLKKLLWSPKFAAFHVASTLVCGGLSQSSLAGEQHFFFCILQSLPLRFLWIYNALQGNLWLRRELWGIQTDTAF